MNMELEVLKIQTALDELTGDSSVKFKMSERGHGIRIDSYIDDPILDTDGHPINLSNWIQQKIINLLSPFGKVGINNTGNTFWVYWE